MCDEHRAAPLVPGSTQPIQIWILLGAGLLQPCNVAHPCAAYRTCRTLSLSSRDLLLCPSQNDSRDSFPAVLLSLLPGQLGAANPVRSELDGASYIALAVA